MGCRNGQWGASWCYLLGLFPVTLSHPPQSWRIKQLEGKAMFLLNRGIQDVPVGMCMSGVNIFIFILYFIG